MKNNNHWWSTVTAGLATINRRYPKLTEISMSSRRHSKTGTSPKIGNPKTLPGREGNPMWKGWGTHPFLLKRHYHILISKSQNLNWRLKSIDRSLRHWRDALKPKNCCTCIASWWTWTLMLACRHLSWILRSLKNYRARFSCNNLTGTCRNCLNPQ